MPIILLTKKRGSSTGSKPHGNAQKHQSSFQGISRNNGKMIGVSTLMIENPHTNSRSIPPPGGNSHVNSRNTLNPRGSSQAKRGSNQLARGGIHASTVHYTPTPKDRLQQHNTNGNFGYQDPRAPSPLSQTPTQPQHQALTNANKEIEKLKKENTKLKAEIDHLTSRLSSFASKQLSAGNPNITDLSDLNRPSKIGENFSQIYDDEWSEAYEGLKSTIKSEEHILKILSSLIQQCFEFASTQSNTQQEQMVRSLQTCMLIQDHQLGKALPPDKGLYSICQRHAKDFRKSAALSSVPGLKKLFKETILKKSEIYQKLSSTSAGKTHIKSLEDYCDALVQQAWLMRVQDPPMVMCFAKEGEDFRRDEFKEYNKKGKTTKLCVWPSVRLHTDGHLVSKGHVLPV